MKKIIFGLFLVPFCFGVFVTNQMPPNTVLNPYTLQMEFTSNVSVDGKLYTPSFVATSATINRLSALSASVNSMVVTSTGNGTQFFSVQGAYNGVTPTSFNIWLEGTSWLFGSPGNRIVLSNAKYTVLPGGLGIYGGIDIYATPKTINTLSGTDPFQIVEGPGIDRTMFSVDLNGIKTSANVTANTVIAVSANMSGQPYIYLSLATASAPLPIATAGVITLNATPVLTSTTITYNQATGILTVKEAGIYSFVGASIVTYGASPGTGGIYLQKVGAGSTGHVEATATSEQKTMNISNIDRCASGDTFTLNYASSTTGATMAGNTTSLLSPTFLKVTKLN